MKSVKRAEFLLEYIEKMLSEYKWFKGVKLNVTPYEWGSKIIPSYEFYFDTRGYSLPLDFEDKFDTMFTLLFPRDNEDDELTAVWEFLYV